MVWVGRKRARSCLQRCTAPPTQCGGAWNRAVTSSACHICHIWHAQIILKRGFLALTLREGDLELREAQAVAEVPQKNLMVGVPHPRHVDAAGHRAQAGLSKRPGGREMIQIPKPIGLLLKKHF